jgi:methyl-accepting chemotaxis protein
MSKWFKGFRGKMLALIGLSSLICWALAIYSFMQINTLGEKIFEANEVRIPMTQSTNEMSADLQAIARFTWAAITFEDEKEVSFAIDKAQDYIKMFEAESADIEKLPKSEFVKKKLDELHEVWPDLKKAYEAVLVKAKLNTKEENALGVKLIVTEVRPLMNKATGAVEELNQYRDKLLAASAKEDRADLQRSRTILILVSVFAGILLLTIGFMIASKVASVLTQVIDSLGHHSNEVSQASAGLSSASSQLSAGATETASSLEETVASTEELNSMVKTNSDNASQAATLASDGRNTAETGEKNITSLHQAVGEVSKASKQIEEIISVIDDIAFQTNLLALNAAVEAARAGEQGKGFAVVAEAVRNLAQRSAVAAKDIANLIKDSVGKIEDSRILAEKSKESLSQIVQSIHKISDINAEIATASQEQSAGLSNISKAMNEIDRATQQNASSSEEISATSEEMTAQAKSLGELVQQLAALMDGGTGHVEMKAKAKAVDQGVHSKSNNVVPMRTRQAAKHSASLGSTKTPSKEEMEALLPMEGDRKVSKVDGF